MKKFIIAFVITAAASAPGIPILSAQTPANSIDARLAAIEQRLGILEKQLGIQSTEPDSDLATRLEALDQQIRIVGRQRELDQEAAAAKGTTTAIIDTSRDGFTIRSADNSFQLRTGGYIQADGRFFVGPNQVDSSAFVLRRIRPIVQGTVYKNIDFRIMTDFGSGNVIVQEAYADLRYWKKASLRFGKFKSPFGLERLQSAADMTFVDRGLPTALAPNRDEGIQLYGDFNDGALSYSVAVMNGVVDGGINDTDTNDGKDWVARIFAQPFVKNGAHHAFSGLGFGLAASRGRQSGTILPTYKTVGQSTFFTYSAGVTAGGDRQRFGPQAYYYAGPIGILAEYTASAQDIRNSTAAETITNRAWQVAGSYFLTGENKSYRTISPITSFDPATHGKGALELTARVGELTVDSSAFDRGFANIATSAHVAREWIAGVNWYLNRNSKFVIDYEQTRFTGGNAGGNRATERGLLTRFQVAF
ncbi:MAG TPA: porin [Terriglobia bacterium]|nr:porin [Terriglobia bacterium]